MCELSEPCKFYFSCHTFHISSTLSIQVETATEVQPDPVRELTRAQSDLGEGGGGEGGRANRP